MSDCCMLVCCSELRLRVPEAELQRYALGKAGAGHRELMPTMGLVCGQGSVFGWLVFGFVYFVYFFNSFVSLREDLNSWLRLSLNSLGGLGLP